MEKKYIDATSETEYTYEITLRDTPSDDEAEDYIENCAQCIAIAFLEHRDQFRSLRGFLKHVYIQNASADEILQIHSAIKSHLKDKRQANK